MRRRWAGARLGRAIVTREPLVYYACGAVLFDLNEQSQSAFVFFI
jgi:hypothetical protein